ncbi:MAG: HlyD family type I secretion periplasmic adaptor subunit [Hyphomicrobium sp.]
MNDRRRRKRSREELEFLPAALEILETPPSPSARWTAWLIMLLFVLTIGWSIWGRIDTVATAEGQLVTKDRVKVIQPLETSIVRAIHVSDGQSVKQGELLIELDPTETQANVDSVKYDLLKSRLEGAAAKAILTDDPTSGFEEPESADANLLEATRLQMLGEWEKQRASLASIDADIEDQQAQITGLDLESKKLTDTLPIIEERLKTQEDLFDKGLSRKPEMLQLRQTVIETKSNIENTKAQQLQGQARLDSKMKKREEAVASFRATHLEKRTEALRKIATLEQQSLKEGRRGQDRQLRAPVDGTVFGLQVFTIGGVVSTKDTLMRIAPAGSELEAEVTVLNKDIGFVEAGQDVEIKLETFPFTRYGLIPGVVKQVGRDAIPDEKKGLVYKAEVTLKKDKILVGDKWVPLAPGMSMQAEIKTGDRRVIEYFLSPFLRYRDEALRER